MYLCPEHKIKSIVWNMKKKKDYLWKGILEDIFDDFLRFMYPNADEMFDFKRGITFLDKELEIGRFGK